MSPEWHAATVTQDVLRVRPWPRFLLYAGAEDGLPGGGRYLVVEGLYGRQPVGGSGITCSFHDYEGLRLGYTR